MFTIRYIALALVVFSLSACKAGHVPSDGQSTDDIFTKTISKPLDWEIKRTFQLMDGALSVSNDFVGGRLADFKSIGNNQFMATIKPENSPINKSPWYSFKLWSKQSQQITILLAYVGAKHRYLPKVSVDDGTTWQISDTLSTIYKGKKYASFQLSTTRKPIWVSAQEYFSPASVYEWTSVLANKESIKKDTIGYSHLGQVIELLKINYSPEKKLVVILGRQHPPEVPGYLALRAFMKTILSENDTSCAFFKKYGILMFPMINPDGISLGHWRHNLGGVDTNRDWVGFHQPETQAIRAYFEKLANKKQLPITIAIDFHATYRDVFYVLNDEAVTNYRWLTQMWLDKISTDSPTFKPAIEASGLVGSSSAKVYFFSSLATEFVTYEIGDETPRDAIARRANVAARHLMQLLVEEK